MRVNNVAGKTLKEVLHRLNELWAAIFTKTVATSISDADHFIVRDASSSDSFKKITSSNLATYVLESASTSTSETQDQLLREWAQGVDYEPLVITRDIDEKITTMTIKWPDGSSGIYTATDHNDDLHTYDGFSITHANSGLTITQTAVTRNSEGAIINKPPLTVI